MTSVADVSRWKRIAGVAILILIAVQRAIAQDELPARQAAMRQEATDQLKTICVALHNYHDVNKAFPAPAILSPDGKLLLSWRVAILPYSDQVELYKQFDLTQPWDSKHNKRLLAKMPAVYRCPGSKAPADSTVYLTPRGDATVFAGPKGIGLRHITDGTSNTIAIVEANDSLAIPWTKPGDWPFNPATPSQSLGGHFPGVMLVSFCDGSVHSLPNTINSDALRALFTRNGEELVSVDQRGNWKVGN